MMGALAYKNLPVLPQMSMVLLQWLCLLFICLHITHDNKRRKRCCVIYSLVLHLTALHTSGEVDSEDPAVIFPLLFPLVTCTSSHFRHTSETGHLSRNHYRHKDKSGTPTTPLPLAL